MIKTTITSLLFTLLFSSLCIAKEQIDLTKNNQEIKLLDTKKLILPKKTKEDYEKEEDLLEPVEEKIISIKKDDKITIKSQVDFDKDNKEVDSVKVNLGTKF